jgi:hypothetical protein
MFSMTHARALKKIIASSICIVVLLQISSGAMNALQSSGSAPPWTRDTAEHLARRAVFAPTPNLVESLYQAGSASAAVALLFPDNTGPDRTQYNGILQQFTASGYSATNETNVRQLYQIRYALDPYPAKAKLFSLFEDIFSVNANPPGISYGDVQQLHSLIYDSYL